MCTVGDKCRGEDESRPTEEHGQQDNHGCTDSDEDEGHSSVEDDSQHGHQDYCGSPDLSIGENEDGVGHGSDYSKKSGRRGGRRVVGRQRKKCRSRGARAPAPWIVDPRLRGREENINEEDLTEEQFFPSRRIEVNEEGQHQAIGCISPPEPENQVLHYPGYHFVMDLVLACRRFLSNPSNENNAIMKLFQFLNLKNATNDYSAEYQRTLMAFDSLESLAARCGQAEENTGLTNFVFMVNAIQLRSKVIRFVFPISCGIS
jgi:hypothetical protein